MSTDKELLIECLQNMGITVGILAGIEEHMIEYPHKSKSALHQLNQELQEYLETYGVDAAWVVSEVKTEIKKEGKADDSTE